jgi:hypothetical protein
LSRSYTKLSKQKALSGAFFNGRKYMCVEDLGRDGKMDCDRREEIPGYGIYSGNTFSQEELAAAELIEASQASAVEDCWEYTGFRVCPERWGEVELLSGARRTLVITWASPDIPLPLAHVNIPEGMAYVTLPTKPDWGKLVSADLVYAGQSPQAASQFVVEALNHNKQRADYIGVYRGLLMTCWYQHQMGRYSEEAVDGLAFMIETAQNHGNMPIVAPRQL